MTILVTGGRGTVARAVTEQLRAAGVAVRVASREPGAVSAPPGVQVVAVDLARPETAPAALADVHAVFLYAAGSGVPEFLAAAAAAKVERIVLLSSLSTQDAGEPTLIARQHLVVEEAIAASGLAWTFVRPGAFATNALAWAPQIRAGGAVRDAYPESHSSPVHERDIAEVSVRALLERGHEGARYALTGPESLTRRRQVELIEAATGQPVRIEEISPEQERADMIAHFGGSGAAGIVDTLLHYRQERVGSPDRVVDTVQKVTGHPARTFATWAADHAGDFLADGR